MDKNKILVIVYFLTAMICYVCSIVWFKQGRGAFGALWLCIGSANLCLGVVYLKKNSKKDDE